MENNPYVGPRPFERGQTLYGRQTEVLDLLDLLTAERIVLLHSPSGAGKTSLIQAALIPALEERFHVLPVLRVGLTPPEAAQLPPGINRYLLSVLLSLESVLSSESMHSLETMRPGGPHRLEALAQMSLAAYLGELRAPDPSGDRPLCLIFDQFEEVLSLSPTDQEVKRAFFRGLGEALRSRERWALFVMREDYVGSLEPYRPLLPTQLRTTFRLDFLSSAAAPEAIREPAQAQGVTFAAEAARKLVDDLRQVQVQQLDGTLETQAGPYVEPVQLQVVCYRLWEQLPAGAAQITLDHLRAVGSVDEALAGYYAAKVKAAAAQTGVSERAIREWVGQKLITRQGLRGQVMQGADLDESLPGRAVQALIDAYLAREEKRRGVTWYELAHDRLLDPVQRDNAAWFAGHLSALQRQAKLWADERRPEGLLFGERALTEAEGWARAHAGELASTEREFLKACRLARGAARAKARADRRLRMALVAEALVLVLVVAVFGVKLYQDNQTAQVRALIGQSALELAKGNKLTATMLVLQALNNYPYMAEAEQALGNIIHPPQTLLSFHSRFEPVVSANFDHEGTQLTTVGLEGRILRWDVLTGQQLAAISGPAGYVSGAIFSPDGRRIVAIVDGTVGVWEAATGQELTQLPGFIGNLSGAVFSPDGGRVVTEVDDDTARVWDTATGRELAVLAGHAGTVNSAAFSPDGNRIVTASDDNTARVWDAATGQEVATLSGHTGTVTGAAFSPDGRRLVTLSHEEGAARVWDAATGRELSTFPGHTINVTSAVFSPDGAHVVLCTDSDTAQVWDAATGQPLASLFGHVDSVISAVFSPDGKRIVTTSNDYTARVWDAATGREVAVLAGHTQGLTSAVFSPDGKRIVTLSQDEGAARVWEAATGAALSPIPAPLLVTGHTAPLNAVILGPAGTRIVTASDDGTARLWEVATGHQLAVLNHASPVRYTAFSPDGTRLVTAGSDDTARVWDAATGQPLAALAGYTRHMTSGVFSPDGRRIVLVRNDNTARVWDAGTGQQLAVLSGHTDSVASAVFSPDGGRLVTASADQTARVWDASTGQQLAVLSGHTDSVASAVFSPDGARLVTASADQTVRVWDAGTGQQLAVFSGHTGSVESAIFSPDGTQIAAMDGQTVRVWDVATGRNLALTYGDYRGGDTAAFSPEGTRMVTASEYSGVLVWDIAHAQTLLSSEDVFAAFAPDGLSLLIGRRDGLLKFLPLWPPYPALLEGARAICGDCEPTDAQRAQFKLYTWPMLVREYGQILAGLWFLLLYGVCVSAAYRALGSRSQGPPAPGKLSFTWKRFAVATGQGGVLAGISLGTFLLMNDTAIIWWSLPLWLWAGGCYGYLTRFQQGSRARLKRVGLGGLAGSAAGGLGSILVMLVWYTWALTTSGETSPLLQSADLVFLLIEFLIPAIAGLILGLTGAALYVFALQPLAVRWQASKEEED
jgi:WD40 repeat protein